METNNNKQVVLKIYVIKSKGLIYKRFNINLTQKQEKLINEVKSRWMVQYLKKKKYRKFQKDFKF